MHENHKKFLMQKHAIIDDILSYRDFFFIINPP